MLLLCNRSSAPRRSSPNTIVAVALHRGIYGHAARNHRRPQYTFTSSELHPTYRCFVSVAHRAELPRCSRHPQQVITSSALQAGGIPALAEVNGAMSAFEVIKALFDSHGTLHPLARHLDVSREVVAVDRDIRLAPFPLENPWLGLFAEALGRAIVGVQLLRASEWVLGVRAASPAISEPRKRPTSDQERGQAVCTRADGTAGGQQRGKR